MPLSLEPTGCTGCGYLIDPEKQVCAHPGVQLALLCNFRCH